MTTPADPPPWHNRPLWQIRLLQQIQDLAAHRTLLTRTGPRVNTRNEEHALHAWRTQLHRLEQLRTDLEARAAATGLPRRWIDSVLVPGHRGARYADTYPAAPAGPPTPRDRLIDGLAADVWQLQHMAALAAARREWLYEAGTFTEPDPATAGQFDRNMVWLWLRAGAVADSLELTVEQRDGLWATDGDGWRRLVEATVVTYDDTDLHNRWRAHADPALETQIATSVHAPGPHGTRGPIPPLPPTMIAAAEAALTPPAVPGTGITTGIDAVVPDPSLSATGIDPATPQHTAPARVHDAGAEL